MFLSLICEQHLLIKLVSTSKEGSLKTDGHNKLPSFYMMYKQGKQELKHLILLTASKII